MKTQIRNLVLVPALIAGVGSMLAPRVTAQTFATLHSFTGGSDGAWPVAGLMLSGNTMYGTTTGGGRWGLGAVFAVNTDGTGFTNLYSFTTSRTNSSGVHTNSDGTGPEAGLILSGHTLYGTANSGGISGRGTVFAVSNDGTRFTNLHSFTATSGSFPNYINNDGAFPYAGLILSGNTLYGTAEYGGSSAKGTVFAVNTDGTGFTILHTFTGTVDGAYPIAGLVLSGNTLYGTANRGGSSNDGTVFKLNTNGTGFTKLHTFTRGDGAYVYAGLLLLGDTLYGTTLIGGSPDNGTVFKLNTNGTSFASLHSFTTTPSAPPINSDGANPWAGLSLSNNILYGTTIYGGSSGNGTVFALKINGTGFTNLHSFNGSSDGDRPEAGVILCGNTLYGTANYGGSSTMGTVFRLTLPGPPQLTVNSSGTSLILTWPTNATGFRLQSTTNLVSPALWTTNSPAPVVVNGQNVVTNQISGTQQFFRLSQ